MGHMNVMWYVGKFDEATWNLFATLGVTTAFLKEHRRVLTGVHIDAQTRKSCPFPAQIVERGRSLVRPYDLPT
jgi:acyl-CoA thioester hydrolase